MKLNSHFVARINYSLTSLKCWYANTVKTRKKNDPKEPI